MFGKRLINTGGVACTTDTLQILGDTSCVATYRLNGDATDLSGNYNGTATNVSYVAGKFDDAGSFNGSNGRIDLPNINNIASSNVSFSVSLWIKTTSSTYSGVFSDFPFSGFDGFSLVIEFQTNGTFVIFNRITAAQSYNLTTPVLNDGNWHNLLITNNISTLKQGVYIDGVFYSQITLGSGTKTSSANTIQVGYYNLNSTPQYYFNGSIDQVRIFNRAITAAEVTTLYNEVAC